MAKKYGKPKPPTNPSKTSQSLKADDHKKIVLDFLAFVEETVEIIYQRSVALQERFGDYEHLFDDHEALQEILGQKEYRKWNNRMEALQAKMDDLKP